MNASKIKEVKFISSIKNIFLLVGGPRSRISIERDHFERSVLLQAIAKTRTVYGKTATKSAFLFIRKAFALAEGRLGFCKDFVTHHASTLATFFARRDVTHKASHKLIALIPFLRKCLK